MIKRDPRGLPWSTDVIGHSPASLHGFFLWPGFPGWTRPWVSGLEQVPQTLTWREHSSTPPPPPEVQALMVSSRWSMIVLPFGSHPSFYCKHQKEMPWVCLRSRSGTFQTIKYWWPDGIAHTAGPFHCPLYRVFYLCVWGYLLPRFIGWKDRK